MLGDRVFSELKYAEGLSAADYEIVENAIKKAHIETDKPPFFKKKYGLRKFPKIQYMFWSLAKILPRTARLYDYFYRLRSKHDWKILIKETRSLTDMRSMILGLQPSALLFLVRTPQATILSHLKGVQKKKMGPISPDVKKRLLLEASDSAFFKAHLSHKHLHTELQDIEFYAINWVLYHEKALALKTEFASASIYFYDDIMENPPQQIAQIFSMLGLEICDEVANYIAQSSGQKSNFLKDAGDQYYSVYRDNSFNKDSWMEELTQEEIELINSYCKTMYEELGKLKIQCN
ncbi:hypothetical protein D210916BOD24_07990 [Alteromonas sp. D210916BOD_24]